ncbi:hypothetical protein Taro_012258 [Colocasia esculenta]|uniref:C2 domain-containing protein n=1 Tax=Colocasia esculenta TaxID=4460 RepID=A0A843UCD7_COLES|nr:hypothetical protein [Colocasia esculenta]
MAKVRVEVCMVSARGLRRSSSLWKLQWFAVGWIDPNSKYCSKVDSSGSSNPTWNTKFSISVDDCNVNVQDLVLTIQVYRREPVFLGEKLHGSATVALKEFLGKYADGSGSTDQEVGSFQLRKKKSGKPRGFVDVSVRVSRPQGADGVAGQYPGSGYEEVLEHRDRRSGISLAIDDGPVVAYPSHARRQPGGAGDYRNYSTPSYPYLQGPQGYLSQPEAPPPGYPHNQRMPMISYPHTYQTPAPAAGNGSPPPPGAGPPRQGTPPPPPPPSNTGFIPSLFPGMGRLPESYVNVPSSTGRTARGVAPGFGAGLGAGALAAGAVIFGDDFMAASEFPAGFGGGDLTLSADPPF